MNELLVVKDLSTHFFTDRGVVKAVDNCSFVIREGETLGIVGESGCGKSVTAMSILNLIEKPGRIVSGSICFDGKELVGLNDKEIRMIRGNYVSMVFQEPMTSLNPVFKIGDQIVEALRIHQKLEYKEAHKKAVEMLTLVGIPRAERVSKDYPHQLSGGMRQRAMIAMALACSPKLLIADEPTTALDVTIQAQILSLMNELKEKVSTAIMLITHDLGVIAQMADHVLVMYSGRVVESAPVKELFENPMHPYTVGLLASIPSLDEDKGRLHSIDGVVPSPFELPEGCYFAPRCDKAMDICRRKRQEISTVGESHGVSCFLFNQEEG